jgi:hypothetical protein
MLDVKTRHGKVTMNIAMSKLYLKQGKKIVFCTMDQRKTVLMLSEHFPNALFELVGDWGVKIHERR